MSLRAWQSLVARSATSVVLLAACSANDVTTQAPDAGSISRDGGAAADGGEPLIFVAFGRDFENFRTWEKFVLPEDPDGTVVHLAGKRTEYLNKRPPAGAKAFPIGTIIVKEMDGDLETRQIFAMVKRGGGFNPSGAKEWEWFELTNKADGVGVNILWRGVGPPDGERYGGAPAGACNVCHGGSKSNDYVTSAPLHLLAPQ